jgi:hypothetical protein
MAAGAGEAAAIDASLPIAQADAAAWLRSQSENTQAKNTFSRDSNTFRRQGALDIAGAGFTATEGGRQRTWQSGENTMDRSSRESIANTEISAANARLSQQLAAQSAENAKELSWRGEQSALEREFTAATNASDRAAAMDRLTTQIGAEAAQKELDRAAATARDAVQQEYRLAEIDKLTESQLAQIDAQNGTNLARDYRVETTNLYSNYARDVSRINESDMDPDVKAAQIAELKTTYTSMQGHLTTVYSSQPGWSNEWATYQLDFGDDGTKTAGTNTRQP